MYSIKFLDYKAAGLYNDDGSKNPTIKKIVHSKFEEMNGNRCSICELQIEGDRTIEHVIERSSDVSMVSTASNLVPACAPCNNHRKSGSTVINPMFYEWLHESIVYNSSDGTLSANEHLETSEKEEVEETIRAYKLNKRELKNKRMQFFSLITKEASKNLFESYIKNGDLDNENILFPSMLFKQNNLHLKYYERGKNA